MASKRPLVTGTASVQEISNSDVLTIPSGTGPTLAAAGDIAIDTNTDNSNITDASILFHDGTRQYYVASFRSLPTTDGHALVYDGTNKRLTFSAVAGGSGLTHPQVMSRVFLGC